MKKEQKRYLLVEYYSAKDKLCETKEQLDDALNSIRLNNNRLKAPFLIGNITISEIDGKYNMHYHVYNKLENRMTISDIDNMTSKMNEHDLIIKYRDKLRRIYEIGDIPAFYPDINIAYLEDDNNSKIVPNDENNIIRKIKYIPVLYNYLVHYMDRKYIDNCLYSHAEAGDIDFFEKMVDEFSLIHNAKIELDILLRGIDSVMYEGATPLSLYDKSRKLYKAIIVERDKDGSILRNGLGQYEISRRRLRDFGFFVKNYNSAKTKTPTAYSYSISKKRIEALKQIRNEIDAIRQQEKEESLKLIKK